MNANTITCPKCKQTFEPQRLEVGNNVDHDTELLTQCACGARFYTFVPLAWEPLED